MSGYRRTLIVSVVITSVVTVWGFYNGEIHKYEDFTWPYQFIGGVALLIWPFVVGLLYTDIRNKPVEDFYKERTRLLFNRGGFGLPTTEWERNHLLQFITKKGDLLGHTKRDGLYDCKFSLYYTYRAMKGVVDTDNQYIARTPSQTYEKMVGIMKNNFDLVATPAICSDVYSYMVFYFCNYPKLRTILFAYADRIFKEFGIDEYAKEATYSQDPKHMFAMAPSSFGDFATYWKCTNQRIYRNMKEYDKEKFKFKFEEEKIMPLIVKCYLLYLEDLRLWVAKDGYSYRDELEIEFYSSRILNFVLTEMDYYMAQKYINWFETNYPNADEKMKRCYMSFLISDHNRLEQRYNYIKNRTNRMRFAEVIDGKVTEVDSKGNPVSQELKDFYAGYKGWIETIPYQSSLELNNILYIYNERMNYYQYVTNAPGDIGLPYLNGEEDLETQRWREREEKAQEYIKYTKSGKALRDYINSSIPFDEPAAFAIKNYTLAPKDLKFEH